MVNCLGNLSMPISASEGKQGILSLLAHSRQLANFKKQSNELKEIYRRSHLHP